MTLTSAQGHCSGWGYVICHQFCKCCAGSYFECFTASPAPSVLLITWPQRKPLVISKRCMYWKAWKLLDCWEKVWFSITFSDNYPLSSLEFAGNYNFQQIPVVSGNIQASSVCAPFTDVPTHHELEHCTRLRAEPVIRAEIWRTSCD